MQPRRPSWSPPSRCPAMLAWSWPAGSWAACSRHSPSCAPSSVAPVSSATPRRSPSRSRAPRRRRRAAGRSSDRAARFLEVTGGDALQVEDRDQHFEALRAPRVGRQNGRAEPNPLTTDGLPVAHARLAHRHRSDAGHDLTLRQMTVTHDALVARLSLEIGISSEEVSDFRLHSLREKGTRPVAQNLGWPLGAGPWLRQLDDVSVGHGVSLLRWRSGGVEHPHDTPPYPFMPSPTSAHSSFGTSSFRADGFSCFLRS